MVDHRKITHEPRALPAQKRARHVGVSEHSSSSATAGASEHAVEPPAIPDADVDWNEEEHAEEEKQAEEIWMASQMLWMVSQVLPAFADTEDNKKASSTESHDMPNDFAARILECEVAIPDVQNVMTQAVNTFLTPHVLQSTGVRH